MPDSSSAKAETADAYRLPGCLVFSADWVRLGLGRLELYFLALLYTKSASTGFTWFEVDIAAAASRVGASPQGLLNAARRLRARGLIKKRLIAPRRAAYAVDFDALSAALCEHSARASMKEG